MLRKFKQSLGIVFSLLLVWGIIYGYTHLTDGFSVREMSSSLTDDPEYHIPPPSSVAKERLKTIVNQPFKYLGKGCQFYAFESQDGEFVLKFFKHKHLRPLNWLEKVPLPSHYREVALEKIEKRRSRIENLFSSCKLAYEELSEETGVLYVHLTKTPALETEVVIIDKIGFKHTIELDKYEYVLQKKACQAGLAFKSLSESHREELAKQKIHQLVNLIAKRCEKGIRDRDRSFVQNVAFTMEGEEAVFVDIGQFFKDESIKTQEETEKDLLRRLKALREWTTRYTPDLTKYVDEEICHYNVSTLKVP